MRTYLALLTALIVLAATGTAFAGTPPTITVDPASLPSGKPTFTWAVGPDQETITNVYVGTSSTPDFVGRVSGFSLAVPGGATSVTSAYTMWAGTNYFNGYWYSPSPTAGGQGYTPVSSFELPPVAKFTSVGVQQSRRSTMALAGGKFSSNSRTKVTLSCTIKQGRTVVDTGSSSVKASFPGASRTFTCSMNVPESYDNKSLKLIVTAKIGTKTFTNTHSFVGN